MMPAKRTITPNRKLVEVKRLSKVKGGGASVGGVVIEFSGKVIIVCEGIGVTAP